MNYKLPSPVKAAQGLRAPVNTLYAWIRKAKQHGGNAHVGSGSIRPDSPSGQTENLKRIRAGFAGMLLPIAVCRLFAIVRS
ncbi:MAG: hypothetical protein FWG30_03105 [Eubacteriaceae bacterium]|nr:hypothetical protein [Eubacteriaceae bacterium]